jgi:hypothetical protein
MEWMVRASCVCALVCLGLPGVASAQGGKEMTAEQIRLLNEANRALAQAPPDLAAARASAEQALEKGGRFDLILLTYGRVLQKSDECRAARGIFNEMGFAPHEPSVSVEDLARLKTKYIGQMEQLCSAVLTVTCTNPSTELVVAGKPLACGGEAKLTPGAHQIKARVGQTSKVYDVELEGAEERKYNVALTEEAIEDPGGPPTSDAGFGYTGTVIAGVSTVVLTAAATGVWAYASGQQDAVLEGRLTPDGFWRDDVPPPERARLESEANDWGNAEVAAGVAIPVVAGIGVAATALLFVLESGGESLPAVSLGVDPARGAAMGTVRLRF